MTVPSLFDAITAEREAAAKEAEVASAQPQETVEPVEVEQVATEVAEETQEPEETSGGDSGEKWGLRSWLAQAGYDPEELEEFDDEELDKLAKERFSGGGEPSEQAKDGNATQPAKDGAQAESPSLSVKEEKVEKVEKQSDASSALAKLEYDHSIVSLVKEGNGRFLPVDDSPEAIEAAKSANTYNKERKDRLTRMIDDPIGTLGPYIKDMAREEAKQLVKAEMEELRRAQEESRAAESQRRAAEDEQGRYFGLIEKHKADIYKLSDSGEPRKSFKTGQLMMTAYGKEVNKNYLELQELSPSASRDVLLSKAVAMTRKYMQPETAKPKEVPEASKRQTFLDKARKADVDTDVSKKPASVSEAVTLGANMSLLEAIRLNDEIQDNPTVQALRNRR